MRIGLVRHFQVEQAFPSGWRTAGDLHMWRERYEASPAIVGPADLGALHWSECISSDLERAVGTARSVFNGPIEKTALLREAHFAQFETGNLRLPVWAWRWILRISWMTGHKSQRACRDEFRHRVVAAADLLERKRNDILVVSHAIMIVRLSVELRRRGFAGPKLKFPKHATLYVYEQSGPSQQGASASGLASRRVLSKEPLKQEATKCSTYCCTSQGEEYSPSFDMGKSTHEACATRDCYCRCSSPGTKVSLHAANLRHRFPETTPWIRRPRWQAVG